MNSTRTNFATVLFVALLVVSATLFQYDGHSASQTVRYTYDAAGRLVTATYDANSAIHYQYDRSGNRIRLTVVGPGNPRADHNTNSLYDLWELVYFHNLDANPTADTDGDTKNNREESAAWTDPTNPQSLFSIAQGTVAANGDMFILKWPSQTNALYSISKSTNLVEGFWLIVTNLAATPPSNTYTDTVTGLSRCFYRIGAQ